MKHAPVIRQPLDARQHAYPYGKKNGKSTGIISYQRNFDKAILKLFANVARFFYVAAS
jgi:hypothetical protein